jgi:hypothetical protein
MSMLYSTVKTAPCSVAYVRSGTVINTTHTESQQRCDNILIRQSVRQQLTSLSVPYEAACQIHSDKWWLIIRDTKDAANGNGTGKH